MGNAGLQLQWRDVISILLPRRVVAGVSCSAPAQLPMAERLDMYCRKDTSYYTSFKAHGCRNRGLKVRLSTMLIAVMLMV